MIEIALASRLARAVSVINTSGLTFHAPADFAEIPDLIRQTGRGVPKPQFDLTKLDFTEDRVFWHFILHEGRAIAGCAAQIHKVDRAGFDAYFRRISQVQFGRDDDPVEHVADPVVEALHGHVVYMGELEKAQEYRGDPRITHGLLQTVMYRSMLKWPHLDHIYAFMPDELRDRVADWGFSTTIRRGVRWKEPVPKGRPSEHLIAMSSNTQIAHEALWEHRELSARERASAPDYWEALSGPSGGSIPQKP